jgi:phospholipase C
MMRARVALGTIAAIATGLLLVLASVATAHGRDGRIRHVVIIYQENHSFDNVLGRLCIRMGRCDGSRTGRLPSGLRIPLATSPDVVPQVGHTTGSQLRAINGGLMDGWTGIPGCSRSSRHACLTQYAPRQIPNLTRLARHFAVSDRTFQMDSVTSWGAHLELVAATLDGFLGDRAPYPTGSGLKRMGWGCDSRLDAAWRPSPGGPISSQPSCVPDYSLDPVRYPYGGAYRPTEVEHVPTLMDELDQAGLTWKLYTAAKPGESGYGWAICPTFAGCLYTSQHRRQVSHSRVLRDARAGRLPNFSVVLPTWKASQHNAESMAAGDNWIGKVVDAIEHGPDWRSTAVFITYDDCGCFYDHVPPPEGLGIRTVMVMVSPWVKPQKTDSHVASIASMLAFTEHVFDLPALTRKDAAAYDFRQAFDYHQRPVKPVPMTHTKVPRAVRERLARAGRPPGGT